MSPVAQNSQPGREGIKSPPKEAITACIGKKPGDACQMQAPQRSASSQGRVDTANQDQNISDSGRSGASSLPQNDRRAQGGGAGVCEYTPDKQYFACRPPDMERHDKQSDNQAGTTKRQ